MLFFIVLLPILSSAQAQDANCDYTSYVQVGQTYYVANRNYPGNYTPGAQCRWIGICPVGYNCRLDCRDVNIPETPSCSMDRLLISKIGDPQLYAAQTYCGRGSIIVVSTGQRISIGLITSSSSPGGSFLCKLTAQAVVPEPSVCRCGERKQNRIVGGQETKVNEYKMMAALVDVPIRQIKCGGVVISDNYVVTAAHCLAGRKADEFAVVVGEHDVTTGADTPGTKAYRIRIIIIHPQYTPSNLDNDIALVSTIDKILFNDYVGPVCLPFKYVNTNTTGLQVTLLGWGTLFFGGPTSNTLQKVDVNVISDNSCKASVSSVTDKQICTYSPGKDACQDDSGGPMLYTDPSNGLVYNLGVISSGRSCASRDPGVSTRVTKYLDWIVATTRAVFCVK